MALIHVFTHVPFEGPGTVGLWAQQRSHHLSLIEVWEPSSELPSLARGDHLIVLGGPMGVHDLEKHPWLVAEKRAIARAIDAGARVLGICLGGQLIAEALGATVRVHDFPEIGWHRVMRTPGAEDDPVFSAFPKVFVPMQWHYDSFSLPPGALRCAGSEACAQQGFSFDDGRVIGLQFHPEMTLELINAILSRSTVDQASPFVQDPAEFSVNVEAAAALIPHWFSALDNWCANGAVKARQTGTTREELSQ